MFDSGIVLASDLLCNLNSTESFNIIKTRVDKTNFLTWAGLRHAVPREFCLSFTVNTPEANPRLFD